MIRRGTAADPLRVGVLVSGSGSNLQALIDRFAEPASVVRIVAVASSRDGVRALARADEAGIEHGVFVRGADGAERDRRLGAWLDARGVELVVLAGYMGILTPGFLAGRVAINVHPSLLPAFPGAHAIEDALAHGARVTGVTVHLVDEGLDSGPIIVQDAVQIDQDDDAGSLAERIHGVEHRLLPETVLALAQDRIALDGRRVRLLPA